VFRLIHVIQLHRRKQWAAFIARIVPLVADLLDRADDTTLSSAATSALCMLAMMCVVNHDPDEPEDEEDAAPAPAAADAPAPAPRSELLCAEVFAQHRIAERVFRYFTRSSNTWARQYCAGCITFLYPDKPLPREYGEVVAVLKDFARPVMMGYFPTIVAAAGLLTLVPFPGFLLPRLSRLLTPLFLVPTFLLRSFFRDSRPDHR
jgi:hypothetical protein